MKLWIEQLKKFLCGVVLIGLGLFMFNQTNGSFGGVAMVVGTVLIIWWCFE